ncbi:metallophosphoesterase family protein [Gemmatimonadota bacterium]
MLTILHGSDLHFGKHFDPEAARAFRQAVDAQAPDLLVLSGDFTQRAKVREYREARAFLDDLPALPLVMTPGNHDVPLYRFWERVLAPRKNYLAFISPELDTVLRIPGATVVALDSTAPLRAIVNGRLLDRQLQFAARAFREGPEADLKVLVTHHNLAPAPDQGPVQFLPGYQECLRAFAEMGVELILGGHLHRAFSASSLDWVDGGEELVMAYSGTTASGRGRARERGKNSFNVIRVNPHLLEVTHFLRTPGEDVFSPFGTRSFPRRAEGSS